MPRKERNPCQAEFQFPNYNSFFTSPRESYLARFVQEGKEDVTVTSSAIAGRYLLDYVYNPFRAFPQEELWMLILNTRNRITHQAMIYRDTLDAAPIRIAEIYRPDIQLNGDTIIIAHNHPSGDPAPSLADASVTEQIVSSGALLLITCLDHIIVGDGRFTSLREAKVGFGSK